MNQRTISSALRGRVVEEDVELTTLELCRACRTSEQQIEVPCEQRVDLVANRFVEDRFHPAAVREAAGRILVGPARSLHDAVE